MQTEHKMDKNGKKREKKSTQWGKGMESKRVEYLELEQTMKFNGSPKILLEWKTVGMFTYFQFHIGQRLSPSPLLSLSLSVCVSVYFINFGQAIEMSLLLISLPLPFSFAFSHRFFAQLE